MSTQDFVSLPVIMNWTAFFNNEVKAEGQPRSRDIKHINSYFSRDNADSRSKDAVEEVICSKAHVCVQTLKEY